MLRILKRFLILLFLVPFLLCACSSKSTETVTFASWGSVTEVKILKEIIKSFEIENPDIKVNFMHIPQNYFQKIHLLFASDCAPDVIFINNLNLPIYAGYLENAETIINKNDYYQQALEGLSADGKMLAVPRDVSNLVLYVNTDKIPLPDTNWKLESLVDKKANNGDFIISYEDNLYSLTPYLSYFGGGILDKNKNIIISAPQSQQAIKFYKQLKNEYKIAPQKRDIGSLTLAQMFLDGKIYMYLSGRWLYPKISENAKFHWAIINFPYGKSPQLCDVSGWAISKNSKHKESAVILVKYLSSKKSAEYFAETGLIIPARKDVKILKQDEKHNEHIFYDVLKKSVPTPVNKDYKKINDYYNIELDL